MWGKLKSFDAYPKLHDDMKVKTFSGAAVSIVAILIITILFFSELSYYLTTEIVDHLYVDTSIGEKMKINFDITFHHIPCTLLSIDAMDNTGEHQEDATSHVKKTPLDSSGSKLSRPTTQKLGHGKLTPEEASQEQPDVDTLRANAEDPNYCGSCYGSEATEGQCCNDCDAVQRAYREKGWVLDTLETVEQCVRDGQTQEAFKQALAEGQGCRAYGYIEVNKVAGNFHFAPGKSFQHSHSHMHDMAAFSNGDFNVSHTIKSLKFGETFPGMVNPLSGESRVVPDDMAAAMYIYYAKIVPTVYEGSQTLTGRKKNIKSNQYSVTEYMRSISSTESSTSLPGLFVFYEMSPLMVKFSEEGESLLHFVTQLCAILGGVFTVAGMVDRVLYGAIKSIEKKMDLGKLS